VSKSKIEQKSMARDEKTLEIERLALHQRRVTLLEAKMCRMDGSEPVDEITKAMRLKLKSMKLVNALGNKLYGPAWGRGFGGPVQ